MSFTLDDRLASDSVLVARINDVQVRLSKDSRFPWLILVPEIENACELHELDYEQQLNLLRASNLTSRLLKQCFSPDKLNVACLGNIVKQLHVHHVARFESDEAWPGPIWGVGEPVIYASNSIADRKALLTSNLKSLFYENKDNDNDNNHIANLRIEYFD